MRKWFVAVFTLALLVTSCGPGVPQLATPADGQTFDLNNTNMPPIQVALTDSDYRDTIIQFVGISNLNGEVTCANAQNSATFCTRNQNTFSAGSCTQTPCEVGIWVYRGGHSTVTRIYFRRGTAR